MEADNDDFDQSSDLCDFGFVLVPQPVPHLTENGTDAAR
jgi:hypothetical protein